MIIRSSYINCKIVFIENFPCNNADELICKKNEVIDKVINEIKKMYNKIYAHLLTKQKKSLNQ
jgi:hypothetical protein